MPVPNISRRGHIEGRQIGVYDDLLVAKDILTLSEALEVNAFTRTEIARPDTKQFRHWVINIPLHATEKLPIFRPTLEALASFRSDVPAGSYRMYRSYCNHASYGDMLFIHTDCKPGDDEITALWFIAREWNPEWGGETLFFNSAMDAEFVVSPRPGRLVLFDGAIPHVGRPPNRICYAPRLTFAMKFERVR